MPKKTTPPVSRSRATRAKAQNQAMVKTATISLPGLPPRTYKVEEDEVGEDDVVYAKYYKKEMGIRSTSQTPEVSFAETAEDAYETQYGLERGFLKRFGSPAGGNPALSEVGAGLDRNLSEEQQELYDEDPEFGDVVPKGARTRPLSDEDEASDEDVEEQAVDSPMVGDEADEEDATVGTGQKAQTRAGAQRASAQNAQSGSAKAQRATADEEEEEEDEEEESVEVDPEEVKTMKKSDLLSLAKELGIKGYKTMTPAKLRRSILDQIQDEDEEEEEEDED